MSDTETQWRSLLPPEGGWERLRARRGFERRSARPWIALAAGVSAAFVLISLYRPTEELELPWFSARLVGERIERVGLRPSGDQKATVVSTDDSAVKFYWMEEGG